MRLITWNIQWGRGVDGRVDLERIVRTARAIADFDVLCVQEVADHFPGLEGNDDRDGFAELARLLPGYTRLEAYALDVEGAGGSRQRFGNAIFTRYGVHGARRHALPWPPDPSKPTMPRVAVEATLRTPMGALRVTTTHLEYYSDPQRRAQALRLRNLHDEACARALAGPPAGGDDSPLFRPAPQTPAAILCGDFNFPPENAACAELQHRLGSGGPRYVDAWTRGGHPNEPHPPTFRLHEHDAGETPYCCDFVFVSEDLLPRVRSIEVDVETRASDHQPVLLELDDR
ncbi:MAG TPA: endonuclease/exonuclease/phosphatase family protein [Usitatibacter sp.]|jgi:endonuclease/exonuclease/phosphatase family metal-dependent hydrolase|nr:endonuclease/exonuclease/phosphatase family protein [Usitatibacter sp.]